MLRVKDKQNYHHSKLPEMHDEGYLIFERSRYGGVQYLTGKKQKVRVIAYPLNDNVAPYSQGIHTAYFLNYATGKVVQASGIWFESISK